MAEAFRFELQARSHVEIQIDFVNWNSIFIQPQSLVPEQRFRGVRVLRVSGKRLFLE